MLARTLIIAASFVVGGCATLDEFGSAGKQVLKNERGYVVGYKETLRNKKTGEVSAHVALFTPILNDAGDVIAYEEQSRSGAIIRDLEGRAIGSRFVDMRSRNTNWRSKGVTIVIGSLDSRRVVADPARPEIWQLVASLSAADLRSIR